MSLACRHQLGLEALQPCVALEGLRITSKLGHLFLYRADRLLELFGLAEHVGQISTGSVAIVIDRWDRFEESRSAKFPAATAAGWHCRACRGGASFSSRSRARTPAARRGR